MTISTPFVVDTTLIQDFQPAGSITPSDIRVLNDSLAGLASTTQSGTTYTLVLADAGTLVEFTSGSAVTITIPTNASVAFDIGTVIQFLQYGAGQLTVSGAGVTFRTATSLTTRAQYSTAAIRKRATDEWVVWGDMT